MTSADMKSRLMNVGGVELEVDIRGSGSPLLLLSSEDQLENHLPLVDALAKTHQVIIPTPPGFGHSPRPDWMTNVDDISYVYLDLIESLKLPKVDIVGFSLGGWIAAEMATKDDSFIGKLVLVDAYGVKIGGPFDVDIEDMWTQHPDKVAAWKWHDTAKGKRDFAGMSDDQLTVVAQNIETFARYCWEPYMHNPKLKRRLHRIKTPTMVIWGANDSLTKPAYGKAYAELISGAKFETIASAGHFPHIEQPDAFMKTLNGFLA